MEKSSAGKSLLSNYIRHATTHNKIREERMMWNQRKSELSREDILPGWSERAARRGLPLVRGHLVSDMVSDMGSSGERYESDPPRIESDSHSPYHWTRKLVKAEEHDPYRWGHSGYKEQHPEEFVSSSDEPAEATPTSAKKKRVKRDRSSSPPPTKKRKHSKKTKKSHKHKRKHKTDLSSSSHKSSHKSRRKRPVSSSSSSDNS